MENPDVTSSKLTAARCTLVMIASGLRPNRILVRDIAEAVGAPKQNWKASSLLRWVEEKMLITN